jgi:hypothetical protein
MVVLALGPGVAHAQGYPENSPEACSDRVDNDGNGYVDCNDPGCRNFAFCQQGAPPPGYQAPPPGYQQAPPPGYAPPPPGYPPPPPGYAPPGYTYQQPPPPKGVGDVIAGFILLGVGIIFIGVSIPFWQDAYSTRPTISSFVADVAIAVSFDILGTVMLIIGAILVPSGFGKMARYKRWQQQQQGGMPRALIEFDLGKKLTLAPAFSLTPSAAIPGAMDGSFGFRLTF